MKPKSMDYGSLEKLTEKAARDAAEYIRYNPKSLWDVDSIENTILSALSEATAAREAAAEAFIALIEKNEGLEKANRGLYLESNQRLERIEELELANATTRSPMGGSVLI